MKIRISIIALGALCCLFSGCGCSKEKTDDEVVVPRMKDESYTNQIVQLHNSQKAVASRAAAIRGKIAALGDGPEKKPEYVDLTNQLAQCEAEAKRIKLVTRETIRARILKDASAKGKTLK